MALCSVSSVAFGYAADRLFEDVTFRLEAGERAALVAPNGAGKSTLLRLIAGEIPPDEGFVTIPKEARVGYYRQSHEIARDGTVLEAFLAGFEKIVTLKNDLRAAELAAASGGERDLERLAQVQDRWTVAGGDRLESRIESIASRLGFSRESLERPVRSLSGGEQGRLRLGVVLALEADLLLVDEPTNHLDLPTIRWLEQHLIGSRAAMLIVSHDRAFLDAVCPRTLELGRATFRDYPLSFTPYHEARAEDLDRERKLFDHQAAQIERTEDFIRRNIAGQKTKQAQSRRRMLAKLDRLERPEDAWSKAERVAFRFAEAPRSGDIVLEARGLGAERGTRTLFAGVDVMIRRGDRIGVVGANGSGKTTLLKLLAGHGQAGDRGEVRRGTNLAEGYYDQHLGSLDPAKSCIEEIRSVRGELSVDATRAYLARFRFWGDDPFREVRSLSGGERSRLALAKLLLEPKNLLFLDEPTNHLDVPAAEILEEALVGFDGTVLLVSHDRRFLETVTTRTIAFTSGGVDAYEGGFRDYSDMLERRESAERIERESRATRNATREPPDNNAAATERRLKLAEQRAAERKRRRVEELERMIAEGESRLETMREALRQAPGDDWEKLADLATKEQALAKGLERAMNEWTALSEALSATDERGL